MAVTVRTNHGLQLTSTEFQTDLSNLSSIATVSRWHKQSPQGSGHASGRPMHVNHTDDVDGSDDVIPPSDVVYSGGVLWVAGGAQNYGGTDVRFNPPIDLSEARIVEFETVLDQENFVDGWIEVVVTDKPYAGAAWHLDDNASGGTPRYGFAVKLNSKRAVVGSDFYPHPGLVIWDEWAQSNQTPDSHGLAFTIGAMHLIRLEVTGTTIDGYLDGSLWFSDTWALPPEILAAAWVHFGIHNHASLKYTPFPAGMVSQWASFRWDGAVLSRPTVHRVPDDFVFHSQTGVDGASGDGVDFGWSTPTAALEVSGVPAGVGSAMLAFTVQTSLFASPATTVVSYELNGNGPHDTEPVAPMTSGDGRNYFLCETVDPGELVEGVNQVEFTVDAPGGGEAPFVGNVELIVFGA